MTIRVSQEVENSINAAVQSGRFTSVDDAMDKAARLLLRQLEQEAQEQKMSEANATPPAQAAYKPIWEVADDIRKTVPAEEWAKLPVDGASQHDHYIYGTPKRPAQ